MSSTGIAGTFSHTALLYATDDDYVAATVPFIRGGLDADEPVLVVVCPAKRRLLQEALGADRSTVLFADMIEVGTNPARIIPAWTQFVESCRRPGRSPRGIGEPIWPERTAAELVECQRDELLLNLAFGDGPGWRLLCPYDVGRLDPDIIDEALRSHPEVIRTSQASLSHASRSDANPSYRGVASVGAALTTPLPPAPATAVTLAFDAAGVATVRRQAGDFLAAAGWAGPAVDDLVLAISEVATNSVRHGGGDGVFRMWQDDDTLTCEVADGGAFCDPLAGRRVPAPQTEGGRGLWIVNQLCDLVQVRSGPAGTVVRMRSRRPDRTVGLAAG